MHFCIDEIPRFRSPQLPTGVDTALRTLLQTADRVVSGESLTNLPLPEDSNLDVIGEILGFEVVADATSALQVVVEGLKRRLSTPVATNEKIRLVTGG